MKICSLYVSAFGRLSDFEYKFSNGLNVIKEDNGFGKSTLASFVKSVLYGFDYGRKGADRANDTDFFNPWDNAGKKYGGHIIYTLDGKQFKLERYFGTTAKQEQATLTLLSTGEILDSTDIGKRLTGLSAEAFAQSTFIAQEKIATVNNADFVQRLSGMLDMDNEQNSFDKAVEGLRSYCKQFKLERGNGGKIFELSNQSQNLEMQIAQSKNNLQKAQNLANQVESLNDKSSQLKNECKHLENELATLSKVQFSTVQKNEPSSQEFSQKAQNKKTNKPFKPLISVLSVLCAIVAVVLCVMSQWTLAVVFSLLAVCLASVVLALSRAKKKAQRQAEQKNQQEQKQLEAKKQQAFDHLHNDISNKLEQCRNQLLQVQLEIGQKQQEYQNLVSTNDVNSLVCKLDDVQQQLSEALYKFSVAQRTVELLKQAKENLADAYLPQLASSSSKLLKQFSNGRFSQVVVDKQFNCDLVEKGIRKPLKYFSRGIREITAFCFRVALSQMLYGTIPFLLLDDTFVNLDEQNFSQAVKLLTKLSKKSQIIYFTCHDRIESQRAIG